MKKLYAIFPVLALAALCACGAPASEAQPQQEQPEITAETPAPAETEDKAGGELRFVYQGVELGIFDKAEPLLEKLGEPQASYVTDSCAYPGSDYLYDYDGFELSVNEIEGTRRVTGICLLDDSVETPQGVRIGMELQEALDAMQMDYQEEGRVYRFVSGDVCLTLRTNSFGEISTIDYFPVE